MYAYVLEKNIFKSHATWNIIFPNYLKLLKIIFFYKYELAKFSAEEVFNENENTSVRYERKCDSSWPFRWYDHDSCTVIKWLYKSSGGESY